MSMWAVFESESTPDLAIAPVSDTDQLLAPHTRPFDLNCPCRPLIERTETGRMIIHNDPERGGCNA